MDTNLLEKQFARMGARLKVSVREEIGWRPLNGFLVDIGRDGHGSFFDVTLGADTERELEVLDVKPHERHLLLLIREPDGRREAKHKYLCGPVPYFVSPGELDGDIPIFVASCHKNRDSPPLRSR